MFESNSSKTTYIFSSMLLGMTAYIISGIIACIVIVILDNYILAIIIAGGIGGLLLGLLLRMRKKIARMAIAGIIGMPIALMLSFFLVEGIGSVFPSFGAYFENSSVPDISAIILMGIIFGAIFGAVVFGRKSILLFALVCGTVSFPFGLLVGAMNSGHWIKTWLQNRFEVFGEIDLNLLATIISFGIGIGLSIGLYNTAQQRKADRSS